MCMLLGINQWRRAGSGASCSRSAQGPNKVTQHYYYSFCRPEDIHPSIPGDFVAQSNGFDANKPFLGVSRSFDHAPLAVRRQLRADLYTDGDYVLHLDSDVLLFEDITYAHIFHLGKPVLPFRRYRMETLGGEWADRLRAKDV